MTMVEVERLGTRGGRIGLTTALNKSVSSRRVWMWRSVRCEEHDSCIRWTPIIVPSVSVALSVPGWRGPVAGSRTRTRFPCPTSLEHVMSPPFAIRMDVFCVAHDRWRQVALFGQRLHQRHHIPDEVSERDGHTSQRQITGVGPRQRQQPFNDSSHPSGRSLAVLERRLKLLDIALACQRPLHLGRQDRQRRPELMGGVGCEALLSIDCEVQSIERAVEGQRHLFFPGARTASGSCCRLCVVRASDRICPPSSFPRSRDILQSRLRNGEGVGTWASSNAHVTFCIKWYEKVLYQTLISHDSRY